jgi:hypothetical protein
MPAADTGGGPSLDTVVRVGRALYFQFREQPLTARQAREFYALGGTRVVDTRVVGKAAGVAKSLKYQGRYVTVDEARQIVRNARQAQPLPGEEGTDTSVEAVEQAIAEAEKADAGPDVLPPTRYGPGFDVTVDEAIFIPPPGQAPVELEQVQQLPKPPKIDEASFNIPSPVDWLPPLIPEAVLPEVPGLIGSGLSILRTILNPVTLLLWPSVLADSDLNVTVPAPRPSPARPPYAPGGRTRGRRPAAPPRSARRPRAVPRPSSGPVTLGGVRAIPAETARAISKRVPPVRLPAPAPGVSSVPQPVVRARAAPLPQTLPGVGRVATSSSSSPVARGLPSAGPSSPGLGQTLAAALLGQLIFPSSPARRSTRIRPRFDQPSSPPSSRPISPPATISPPNIFNPPGDFAVPGVAPLPFVGDFAPPTVAPAPATLPRIGDVVQPLLTPINNPLLAYDYALNQFAASRAQPVTQEQTDRCNCTKAKKRKKSEPRKVCYYGTYVEKARGQIKHRKRKVKCRP